MRSHRGLRLPDDHPPNPLWERACSRLRYTSNIIVLLIHRNREQARSHIGFVLRLALLRCLQTLQIIEVLTHPFYFLQQLLALFRRAFGHQVHK